MASLPARALKLYARLRIKRAPRKRRALVRHLRSALRAPPLPGVMLRGVRLLRLETQGLKAEHIKLRGTARRVVLYLHGGGFVAGEPRSYRSLCSRLATGLEADVLMPFYRRAPEHTFPAALDDCEAAWHWLSAQGWHAQQVILAGDSAGGALALGLMLRLRDAGAALPSCALLLSPCADMGQRMDSRSRNSRSDAMLSKAMTDALSEMYCPREVDRHDPHASPCCADFRGLPPLFLTVSEEELLRDDAYAVQALAEQAGTPVELLSRPDLPHVWPVFYPLLPEAREDVARLLRFARSHCGAT